MTKNEKMNVGRPASIKLSGCVAHDGHARSPLVVLIARRGATRSRWVLNCLYRGMMGMIDLCRDKVQQRGLHDFHCC